jgi:hypothetical protein
MSRVNSPPNAGGSAAFAQIGVIGFDGQVELEALRLDGLPEDAPAILYGCPSLPAGTRTLALETSRDLPSPRRDGERRRDGARRTSGRLRGRLARHQQHRLRARLP